MDLAPPTAVGFMEPLLILPYIFLTSIHFEEKLKLFRAKKTYLNNYSESATGSVIIFLELIHD